MCNQGAACGCKDQMKASAGILKRLLANTYVLALKTQNVHWNVVDPFFGDIHPLTDSYYGELAEAVDELAERIRQLDEFAPATLSEFLKLTTLSEEIKGKTGKEMLRELCDDHKKIEAEIRKDMETLSDTLDFSTADLLNGRLNYHEKTVWMLSARGIYQ